jgi:hypothetical protein
MCLASTKIEQYTLSLDGTWRMASSRGNGCNCSSACRAVTFPVDSFNNRHFMDLLWINFTRALRPILIAAAMNPKGLAQLRGAVAPYQFIDCRKLFSESDIKRAVAFFRISFSVSIRLIRFSSSWILRWSGVKALGIIDVPLRSSRNCLTHLSIAEALTLTACAACRTD